MTTDFFPFTILFAAFLVLFLFQWMLWCSETSLDQPILQRILENKEDTFSKRCAAIYDSLIILRARLANGLRILLFASMACFVIIFRFGHGGSILNHASFFIYLLLGVLFIFIGNIFRHRMRVINDALRADAGYSQIHAYLYSLRTKYYYMSWACVMFAPSFIILSIIQCIERLHG